MVKNVKIINSTLCNIIAFVSIFVICSASDCGRNKKDCPDGSHDKIIIKNNSLVSINWEKEDSPDSIWTYNGTLPSDDYGLVVPNSSKFDGPGLAQCWENYYLQSIYPHYYFIFSHDTVQAIGWGKISGTSRGLLKKVKVDLEYLKNNDFTIIPIKHQKTA